MLEVLYQKWWDAVKGDVPDGSEQQLECKKAFYCGMYAMLAQTEFVSIEQGTQTVS